MADIYLSRQEKKRIEKTIRKGNKDRKELEKFMRELAAETQRNTRRMKAFRENKD